MRRVHRRTGRRAAALIIVLSCLVLISGLVIALLSSVTTELALARADHEATNARLLADTAVNLVVAQVQDGTSRSADGRTAWASQPGMIRIYDDAGRPAGYRKLYSWNTMSGNGAFDPRVSTEQVPAAWKDSPAVFTDLNAPVKGIYPVLDPAAIDTNATDGAVSPSTAVDQFTVSSPASAANPVMPVKWLYMLADGTLHVADTASSGTRAVIGEATSLNPIVGRVAFWTDDETCKININTASEASNTGTDPATWQCTFWDTPHFNTAVERSFGIFQPVAREFQRYPGHPATVSLKGVFPDLTSAQIFALAPRISLGGSEGGTKNYIQVTAPVVTDKDRLYASVDELAFDPQRNVQTPPAQARVEAARFFVTANSRAPELNLFGKPRIAVWPVHDTNSAVYRTVSDSLIAFCSTVAGLPYYFTRKSSYSTTQDISLSRNAALLGYLDVLTGRAIPGFGGSFTKWGDDRRQILTEIFDYIRCTNLNDSTLADAGQFAATLATGYTYGMGQAVPSTHAGWDTQGFGGRFWKPAEVSLQFVCLGNGATTSPAAAAVPVYTNQVGNRVGTGWTSINTPPPNTSAVQAYFLLNFINPSHSVTVKHNESLWVEVEGLDGFKLNGDGMQFPASASNFIGGQGYNASVGAFSRNAQVSVMDPTCMTGRTKGLSQSTSLAGDKRFSFYSAILPVTINTASTMEFTGGLITIKIYVGGNVANPGASAKGDLLQTFHVRFQNSTFPLPKLADRRLIGVNGDQSAATPQDRWDVIQWVGSVSPMDIYFEPANDVVRSMVLDAGDARLLAKRDVPEAAWRRHPDYDNTAKRMAHGYSNGLDSPFAGMTRGKLVPGAGYSTGSQPVIPSHISGALTSTGVAGDWDNGVSFYADGPWINQPDEGSIYYEAGYGTLTNRIPYFDVAKATAADASFFSPNRMMPSPGMLGSLPTGVKRGLPWQTLLFRPGPANHPGLGVPAGNPPYTTPPDYLLLDLFWMPIVEPYAISEPFSTAGKVNLNQQIVPFTYINRNTSLRAVLASERVAVMPKNQAGLYKLQSNSSWTTYASRLPLNLDETSGTLRQIVARFNTGEIFRSPAEICEIYLVPLGLSGTTWTSDSASRTSWYGDTFALVGDNVRERPYANIYNKLTTKSNTYTVHYRVQILRQTKAHLNEDPTVFDTAAGDRIAAEQRGSAILERYLDSRDPRIVGKDFASTSAEENLERYYKMRVLSSRIFRP